MANMKDIAAAAGVSQTTVSLVLSGRYQKDLKISKEVAERVLKTADKMNYRRNAVAGAMKQGRTNIIGFIGNLGESGHSYVLNMINGCSKLLQNSGYLLKMFSLDGADFTEICKQCVEQRLSGVIVRFLSRKQLELLHQELSPYNIPVVILGNSFYNKWYSRTISDDIAGCKIALQHLFELGHRKIGFLTINADWNVFVLRKQGYIEGMQEFGMTLYKNSILTLEEGINLTTEECLQFDVFYSNTEPTAVLCASDILAMKLLVWAFKRKIRVPEDLSVIGFGNTDNSILSCPPLTTISHPYEDMGRVSAEMLLKQIEGAKRTDDQILPVKLVVRDSTKIKS